MPIAFPEPDPTPSQAPELGVRRPDEREHERERERARDFSDDSPDCKGESETGGQLVMLPGIGGAITETATPGAGALDGVQAAAQVWWAEARQTATRAVDGSVLRARPPAIRDSHVRLQRAEWAGGIPALRWAGWIYGYPALAVRAALMVLIWLLDHPSRLIVAGGVTVAALLLH